MGLGGARIGGGDDRARGELVRSFQNPAFASALRRINSLPDGANREKIRELLGPDGEDAVFLIGLTWESIGVLVFRREVTFDLVADFFSGSVSVSWRKLHAFVEEDRSFVERETVWEWFQWLVEQLERHSVTRTNLKMGAQTVYRDWQP